MQIIIDSILDIGPNDPTVMDMNRLAKQLGLKDMLDVALKVSDLLGQESRQVAFKIDMTRYRSVARTILCAAILNYAVFVYPEFFIKVEGEEKLPRIFRTTTAEAHRDAADRYLQQVRDLVSQFEN